jgi:inner membrane protein
VDSITQAAFGAVVGQAGFQHRLGKKAWLWGALGGLLPDFDMLAIVPFGDWAECLYHRGPTHSLFFAPVVAPLLGWLTWRWYARRAPEEDAVTRSTSHLWTWIGLWFAVLWTHPLLDLCTSYGTQLAWPVSDHRFSIDAMAIIDPFYSGPLFLALGCGWSWRRNPKAYRLAAAIALIVSTSYAMYGWSVNVRAESHAHAQLQRAGEPDTHVRAFPTLFQPFLRRVVADDPQRIRVGFLSMWAPHEIEWRQHDRLRHPALEAARRTREYEWLRWFAQGHLAARIESDAEGRILKLDDVRYGMPGPPGTGLWGAQARLNPDDTLAHPLERYRNPMPADRAAGLSDLLRRAFAAGHSPGLAD